MSAPTENLEKLMNRRCTRKEVRKKKKDLKKFARIAFSSHRKVNFNIKEQKMSMSHSRTFVNVNLSYKIGHEIFSVSTNL
jgi:hypothetical protein